MKKSLWYRVFGVGKFPAHLSDELKKENIVLLDEGVKGAATYKNFRAPGRYSNWKRQWFAGSIALTKTRLVAMQFAVTVIDVSLADERIGKIGFALEADDTLLIAYDAGLFLPDHTGTLEYRFRTAQAHKFLNELGQNKF